MPKKYVAKSSECLENVPDLLDRIYCKKQNNPDLIAKRNRCKDDIKAINDAIKTAVTSGDAQKLEKLLTKLEVAVWKLESTYCQQKES